MRHYRRGLALIATVAAIGGSCLKAGGQTMLDREETRIDASQQRSRNAVFERYVASRQYAFGMATSCNGGCGGDSDGGTFESTPEPEEPTGGDSGTDGEGDGETGEDSGDENGL
jgi:hypothetical protein